MPAPAVSFQCPSEVHPRDSCTVPAVCRHGEEIQPEQESEKHARCAWPFEGFGCRHGCQRRPGARTRYMVTATHCESVPIPAPATPYSSIPTRADYHSLHPTHGTICTPMPHGPHANSTFSTLWVCTSFHSFTASTCARFDRTHHTHTTHTPHPVYPNRPSFLTGPLPPLCFRAPFVRCRWCTDGSAGLFKVS